MCKFRRASAAWHGAPVHGTGPNHRQYVVDGYEYFSQKKAAQVSGLKSVDGEIGELTALVSQRTVATR